MKKALLCGLGMLIAIQTWGADAVNVKKELKAADLYGGFEAMKVLPDSTGVSVVLDKRVFKFGKEQKGVIVTDVIDVGPAQGVLAQAAQVKKVAVSVEAAVPEGCSVTVETRTGDSFFDQSKWSPWAPLEKLGGAVDKPAGRYIQVKLTLAGKDENTVPSVSKLSLEAETAPAAMPAGVKVADSKIEQIVRSPIDFKYERMDQEKLAKFRKAINLDAVVAEGKTDFDKLVLLMDWVGSCKNDRTQKKNITKGFYAWDIEAVAEVTEKSDSDKKIGKATIFGHCMSYAEVLSISASALGYKSRHMAVVGFKEASHEVVEVWVPSLKKWVYLDPSLSNYYMDKDTKAVLNIIEQHNIVAKTFVPEGKDMNWFIRRDIQEPKDVVKKIGGKTPIDARLGKWKYGEPMPGDYDWGWSHGYLADGFVQMTPRNDFHANPDANPKKFQEYPGYAGYPFWVDAKTPPKKGVNNWYTRMRDFYWTLDQASMALTSSADGSKKLVVEFGNSMPFFKAYQVKVNGQAVAEAKIPFTWELKAGENKLEVAPVDEFGQVGAASSVSVTCD
ncbi:MAG: hypothetical protein C0404_11285 [Verrucomicrobia bacterium]|nr:hypothetical protein [Verrucomicrobiota bacterium]